MQGRQVEIYGDGNYVRDYIYIDDLSECFFQCSVQKISSGIYNVGTGKGISIFEICSLIEKVIGERIHYQQYPIGKGQVMNNILDCSKIKQEIGWKSHTNMENGIRKMVSDMKVKYE